MRSSTRILGVGAMVAAMMSILACASGIGSRDVHIPPFWVYGQVVTADFNGDGRLDVAVATTCIDGSLHADGVLVYLRNALGSFEAPITYPVGPGPWGLCAGDLDGDGRLDLIACTLATTAPQLNTPGDSGGLFVLRQSPATPGHFLPAVWVPTGGAAAAAAVADLDGDGRSEVVVADLDGDGRLDIVAANTRDALSVNRAGSTLLVLLQTRPGTFTATHLPTVDNAKRVAIADLNGDGHPDIALVSQGPISKVSVFLQSPLQRGVFAVSSVYEAPGLPEFLALGDLNEDGRVDILLSDGPSVLYQTSTPGSFAAPVKLL